MRATIIYVSSNKEDAEFELKTRKDLVEKAGDIPIVGVTQKRVNLGKGNKNIVVGNVGASGFNFCRQNLMACEEAKTDFVISAESDCIYPPEYFEYRPKRLDIPYRNTNIYVQRHGTDYFCKKNRSTFSQVVGRKFYRDRLRMLLEGQPEWDTKMKNFPKEIKRKLFEEFEEFETKYPCLSFKTGKGMRRYSRTDEVPVYKFDYWGKTEDIINDYIGRN